MSRRNKGRIGGPFVPVLKDTMKTEAWKALSHGARSLYVALKGRYNSKLQNAVWLSTRDAAKELGSFSRRENVCRWFRELEYFGFIVMVSLPHHGLNGHGKAPHYRLTEESYQGALPTKEFLKWDGTPFREQKSPGYYQRKNKSRGPDGVSSVDRTVCPVDAQSEPANTESGPDGVSIYERSTGPDGVSITSLPLPALSDDLDIPAFLPRRRKLLH